MPEHALTEMLKWKRPEGSASQRYWCKRYLEPTFGAPDSHGNYIHIVYNKDKSHPNLCFAAHHDTVHKDSGTQNVIVTGDIATAPGSNCLGADCTTGCWLILGMIQEQVPGVYVIHAGEEIGCVGSSALVKDYPLWLDHIDAVISFDRKGTESVITHQLGQRTCSDAFAVSFSQALGMPELRPDNTGSYTDSNEYANIVSECTNISVGYYAQHTSKESQDVFFAYKLLDALTSADWSKLVFERDPADIEPYMFKNPEDYNDYIYGNKRLNRNNLYDLDDMVRDYPSEIASILDDWGVDAEYLWDQLVAMGYDSPERKAS